MKFCNLLILFVIICSCNTDQCTQNFSFEFPLSVTPQDTFQIGDTIWLEMQSSQEVLDVYSGEYYNLNNVLSKFGLGIQKLDTAYIYSSLDEFILLQVEGDLNYQNNSFDDLWIEFKSEEERFFKFGIVPTKTGKFGVEMYLPTEIYYLENGEHKGENLIIHSTNCRQVMYPYSSVVTNNGSTNRHLLDSTCYQVSPTDPSLICYDPNDEIPLSGRGTFAFVVK